MAQYISPAQLAKLGDTGQISIARMSVFDTPFSAATSGLHASYYLNSTLTGTPARTQYDQQPYFNWGVGPPAGMPPVKEFSVSWSGYMYSAYTGTYDFRVAADGGFRMYMGNLGHNSELPYFDKWTQVATVLDEKFSNGEGETWSTLTWNKNNSASNHGTVTVTSGKLQTTVWKTTAGAPEEHRFLYGKNSYSARKSLEVSVNVEVNNLTAARNYEVNSGLFVVDGISTTQDGYDFKGIWAGAIRRDDEKTYWTVKTKITDTGDWETAYEDTASTDATKTIKITVDSAQNLQVSFDTDVVYDSDESGLTVEDYFIVLDQNTTGDDNVDGDTTQFDSVTVQTESSSSQLNYSMPSGIELTAGEWNPIRVDFTKSGNTSRLGIFYSEPDTSPDFGREKILSHGILNIAPEYITPTVLSKVEDIKNNKINEGASTLSFTVPATTEAGGEFTYNSTTKDWGVLKKNSLIKYDAGYRTSDPPDGFDYIPQFVGKIDSVQLTRGKSENLLQVQCRDLTKNLIEHINENLPNQLSYDTIDLFGYGNKNGPNGTTSARPTAYDGWLISDSARDICFNAGIDTEYLFAKDKDGNNLIEDTNVRLEKDVRYYLPGTDNEPFNYQFDFGEKYYDMARGMFDGYGYEFRVNPSGVVLRTFDNPVISNSDNASLNEWDKVEYKDGDVFYNQTNIFSDSFAGTDWDYTKWYPSTSGTGNGDLSLTQSVVKNDNLKLTTNIDSTDNSLGSDEDRNYPYIVSTSGTDISFERKFKFAYTLPTAPQNVSMDQYSIVSASGTYNDPLQNRFDWLGVRSNKGFSNFIDGSAANEQYSMAGKINGISIPHQILNPSQYPVTFPNTSDNTQRTQEITLDVKEQSALLLKENFDGATWDTNWFIESTANNNTSGSVSIVDGELNISSYKIDGDLRGQGGKALSMNRTFDISDYTIISFSLTGGSSSAVSTQGIAISSDVGDADSFGFQGSDNIIDIKRRTSADTIKTQYIDGGNSAGYSVIDADQIYNNDYPHTTLLSDLDEELEFYIILRYVDGATISAWNASIAGGDPNVAGGTLTEENSLFSAVYVNGQLISQNIIPNSLMTKDVALHFYQNSTATSEDAVLKIDNLSIYTAADVGLGVTASSQNVGDFPIIPYKHYSPAIDLNNFASQIPVPYQTGYFGVGTENIAPATTTDTIDNVKIFSMNGPFVSGININTSSDTADVAYDAYVVSNDTFDFSHNLRKVINTYSSDMVLDTATTPGTTYYRPYFQISEEKNNLLSPRLHDNFLRLEADVNSGGIQWNFIESDKDSPRMIQINDDFDSFNPAIWHKTQTTLSGVSDVNNNSYRIQTYALPALSGMQYRSIKTQEPYVTASGLMVECDIFATRLDSDTATNESYVLFSDQDITSVSGTYTTSLDPLATTQEGLMFQFRQSYDSSSSTKFDDMSVVSIHNGVHTSGYDNPRQNVDASTVPIGQQNNLKMRYRWIGGAAENEAMVTLNDELLYSSLDSNVVMPSGWMYLGNRTTTADADNNVTTWSKVKVSQPLRTLAKSTRTPTGALSENISIGLSNNRVRVSVPSLSDNYFFSGSRYGDFDSGYIVMGTETTDDTLRATDFNRLKFTNNGGSSIIAFDPAWKKVKTPRAQGGEYLETSTSGVFAEFDFEGEALKLVMQRGLDSGKIEVKIDDAVVTGFEQYDLSYTKEWNYYQGINPSSASNPSVIEISNSLDAGSHTCRLTAILSGYPQNVKFDAAHSYRISRDVSEFTMSTSAHLSQFNANLTDDDIRNDIIVVGKRFNTFDASDPNNPKFDYIISRAVDADSFSQPGVENYIGERKTTVVIEPSIITKERANYAAFLSLQRHRKSHTLLSIGGMMLYQLEPNDNISVTDSKYGTTGSALYSIQSINSDQGTSKSEASYGITPFRPYPSFQPAVQANLADYDNEPIVNARIEIIDDAGKVISVKEYTETSPFDPYLCDPDKGEYRIRITWDQIVDGIVYINVYNELGDIVRGGNSNIKDQEKNGRLFNKPVDAGLNRMEIWDCTSNLSYYSYKPDEEIPANLDSPPSAELYFEFVHIDRSGIIRKVSTDNKDIKHSETDQKLWVQLGDKIEIAEISVDNAFNMSYLKKFNGNGGAGLDGGYVNIANNVIPAENIRIPDGEDRPNAIKIRTRVLKNVANSTEDGLRIQVNRQRLFYGQFKIMTVPHITFDGIYNLTVQGTGVERNASLNHWYKGIDFKKGMFSYWNYTDPDAWADISNQISEMDGKDRWPNTEYSIVFNINDLAGIDSSDTKELFNTDTAAYESKLRGRISDPYFHNWSMTLYNDSNNDPLPTNSAVFYPTASRTSAVDGHSELMHFKRNKDLVVDEVINIRVTVRDNSGWRYAVSNVTAHVRESRDTTNMVHAEIGGNNVYGQWKRWAWDWNGNWILGQPMTYSNEPTPQTFYEGRPGGRLQGGGTPFANYFYNVSGGPNPDARKRRIV